MHGHPIYPNLRLIARDASFDGDMVTQNEVVEFVRIFSVHLGIARQLAGGATSQENAVPSRMRSNSSSIHAPVSRLCATANASPKRPHSKLPKTIVICRGALGNKVSANDT